MYVSARPNNIFGSGSQRLEDTCSRLLRSRSMMTTLLHPLSADSTQLHLLPKSIADNILPHLLFIADNTLLHPLSTADSTLLHPLSTADSTLLHPLSTADSTLSHTTSSTIYTPDSTLLLHPATIYC